MRRRESHWRNTQCSESFTGRIRHLHPIGGGSRGELAHLLNQAINFPIQSLASDVTASALMDIEAAFMAEQGMGYSEYLSALVAQRRNILTRGLDRGIILPMSQIFNEVHDSLVIDMYPETIKRDTEIIVESMRAVRSLRDLVPGFDHTILGVDVKTHHHWRSK